jgi:predicted DNA-binding protein
MAKHRRKTRIPLDLEPQLAEYLDKVAENKQITRATLLRCLIKFGINNITAAINFGDAISWKPKTLEKQE